MSASCSPHSRGWSLRRRPGWQHLRLFPAPAGMVLRPASRAISVIPCSPLPRGWSHDVFPDLGQVALLLAPAGMVPRRRRCGSGKASAPRTRGDGPFTNASASPSTNCSPHPRGWSLVRGERLRRRALLPAPAGMVPTSFRSPTGDRPAPRTRGDGPDSYRAAYYGSVCSPHPREWSCRHRRRHHHRRLLPAPAGMVPRLSGAPSRTQPAPRTRGDGPTGAVQESLNDRGEWLLPAPAGMVPYLGVRCPNPMTAPRTRGDGPANRTFTTAVPCCSPHPWGMVPAPRRRPCRPRPAPRTAGMVPPRSPSGSSTWPAARTRGDGPSAPRAAAASSGADRLVVVRVVRVGTISAAAGSSGRWLSSWSCQRDPPRGWGGEAQAP